MDVHVQWATTRGIRQRGIDAVTAQEDHGDRLDDVALLARATALHRVVFSYDHDFSVVTAELQTRGIPFSGVITMRRKGFSLHQCLDDLEMICKVYAPEDIANQLQFIPL